MEELKLFDIEPIQISLFEKGNRVLSKRQNKGVKADQLSLVDQMRVEVKKMSLIICKQPKTIKLVPCTWSKKKCEEYIKQFYDENGKFIMQPAGDYDVFGGMQNRQ